MSYSFNISQKILYFNYPLQFSKNPQICFGNPVLALAPQNLTVRELANDNLFIFYWRISPYTVPKENELI
jgi:hypothetical protein